MTPTIEDHTATVTVNGNVVTSGHSTTANLDVVGENPPITIVVTAENGTTKTYTVTVTRADSSSGGSGGNGGSGNDNDNGNGHHHDITKFIGSLLNLTAEVTTSNGQKIELSDFKVDGNSNVQVSGLSPGTYPIVLYVTAPDGQKLAGTSATLTVKNSGQASLKTDLIDPFGTVTDSITKKPIDGVKVTLYWADTALNRSLGRTPGTQVVLPALPDMYPNQNQNAQTTVDGGLYGWMVFPQGDYYLTAEKDGYDTYNSRNDTRDEAQGDTSYVRDGVIHVGQTIVRLDFAMTPKVLSEGDHEPYIFGYPDGTFGPNKNITRAELATLITRILPTTGDAAGTTNFHDVPSDSWFAKAIEAVTQQQIMVGYPDGNFHPNQPVTRAEIAIVLGKLKQLPDVKGQSFKDLSGHWATDAILKAENAGLVSGYPDGTYRPDQALTRAETVVIFNKLLSRSPVDVTVPQKWSDVPTDFWGYTNIMEASVAHHEQQLANGVEIWK